MKTLASLFLLPLFLLSAVAGTSPKTITADSSSSVLLWPTNLFSVNSNYLWNAIGGDESGVLSVVRGGTGTNTVAGIRTALGFHPTAPGAIGTNLVTAATAGEAITILDAVDRTTEQTISGKKTFTDTVSSIKYSTDDSFSSSERFGDSAQLYGSDATAVGYATTAYIKGTAIGSQAFATNSGIALGVTARAPYENSIAIGYGVETTAPHQIMIGKSNQVVVISGGTGNTMYVSNAVNAANVKFTPEEIQMVNGGESAITVIKTTDGTNVAQVQITPTNIWMVNGGTSTLVLSNKTTEANVKITPVALAMVNGGTSSISVTDSDDGSTSDVTSEGITTPSVTIGGTNVLTALDGKQATNVVADLTALAAFAGPATAVLVSDTNRGGLWVYDSTYRTKLSRIIAVTTAGSGFSATPTAYVVSNDGSGYSDAVGTITDGSLVLDVTVTTDGSGNVTAVAPDGDAWGTTSLSTEFVITQAGSDNNAKVRVLTYADDLPSVTVVGGTGSAATGKITGLSGGGVTSVDITSAGLYSVLPGTEATAYVTGVELDDADPSTANAVVTARVLGLDAVIISATGKGVGRWVRKEWSETGDINVLWAGADQSGTVDCTSAFAVALDVGTGTYAPPGTYLFSSTVSNVANVSVRGEPGKTWFTHNSGNFNANTRNWFSIENATNVLVSGCAFSRGTAILYAPPGGITKDIPMLRIRDVSIDSCEYGVMYSSAVAYSHTINTYDVDNVSMTADTSFDSDAGSAGVRSADMRVISFSVRNSLFDNIARAISTEAPTSDADSTDYVLVENCIFQNVEQGSATATGRKILCRQVYPSCKINSLVRQCVFRDSVDLETQYGAGPAAVMTPASPFCGVYNGADENAVVEDCTFSNFGVPKYAEDSEVYSALSGKFTYAYTPTRVNRCLFKDTLAGNTGLVKVQGSMLFDSCVWRGTVITTAGVSLFEMGEYDFRHTGFKNCSFSDISAYALVEVSDASDRGSLFEFIGNSCVNVTNSTVGNGTIRFNGDSLTNAVAIIHNNTFYNSRRIVSTGIALKRLSICNNTSDDSDSAENDGLLYWGNDANIDSYVDICGNNIIADDNASNPPPGLVYITGTSTYPPRTLVVDNNNVNETLIYNLAEQNANMSLFMRGNKLESSANYVMYLNTPTAFPQYLDYRNNSFSGTTAIRHYGATGTPWETLKAANLDVVAYNGSPMLTITNGLVGINTATPKTLLHVGATSPFHITAAGFIGAGTNDPKAQLHVVGSVLIGTTNVVTALSEKAPVASPTFTGTATAPVLVSTDTLWVTNATTTSYFKLTPTNWVDSMVPALGITPGSTAPALATFQGGGLKVYGFNSNQDDEGLFTLQLNHNYKEGTTLKPHVHWAPATAPSGTATNIVWGVEYSVKQPGGTFGAPSTIYVTNDITGIAQWSHQVAGLPDISGSGLTISPVLVGRVIRVSNTMEGATRYDADAMFLGLDVHYQVDTIGSASEWTK